MDSIRTDLIPLTAPRQRLLYTVAALALVVIVIALGFLHASAARPSAVDPASAPASSFSVTRAIDKLAAIAQRPHPTGSEENSIVREYLLQELRALGLTPEVQTAFATNAMPPWGTAGRVANVAARLPGTVPGRAVLVVAHYDSVPNGPGAADNGASVAAMLETLRALKSGPPLNNDVIVLFTDGEEFRLLGAKAFIAEHRWASEVAVVLNFDYRGNRGPLLMYETTPGNAQMVEALARAAPDIVSSSLMYEVYRRIPYETDMSEFRRAGFKGMNFAPIGGLTHYHTALDTVQALNRNTLQSQGETMLALLRQFGTLPLHSPSGPDCIWFDIPGWGLMHYPTWLAWAACMGLVALFLYVLACTRALGQVRLAHLPKATLLNAAAVVSIAIVCQFGWNLVAYIHPQYKAFAYGDTYNSLWYLGAFAALSLALFSSLQAWFRRWCSTLEFAYGGLALWLVLLVAAATFMPGVTFALCWPLAGALLCEALAARGALACPALALLRVFPALLLLTSNVVLAFIAMTPRAIGVPMALFALVLCLAVLAIEVLGSRLVSRVGAALCLACVAIGAMTASFDTEHPRPSSLFYVLDAPTGKASWVSVDPELDAWTAAVFRSVPDRRPAPQLMRDRPETPVWIGAAPPLPLAAPLLEPIQDSVVSGVRTVRILVQSVRAADLLRVWVEGAEVLSSNVHGRSFTSSPWGDWNTTFVGMGDNRFEILLTVAAGKPFTVRLIDCSFGLPATGLPNRPATTAPSPRLLSSDTAWVMTALEFR